MIRHAWNFFVLITARVAKRAKVMFSQAFVYPTGGEEVGNIIGEPPPPPPGLGHNTSLPPKPGHNTSPPKPGHNTSLPHLGPGHNTSPPNQVTIPPFLPPPGPGHNTSLPPGPGHNTSLPPPPPGLCAGGRYASYWNAFLLDDGTWRECGRSRKSMSWPIG